MNQITIPPTLPTDKILSLDVADRFELFQTLSFSQLEAVAVSLSRICDEQSRTLAQITAEGTQTQSAGFFGKLFSR
jgi:hypothetical protein